MKYSYEWQEAFKQAGQGDRKLLDEHINYVYSTKLFPIIKAKIQSADTAHEVCSLTIAKFWEKFYIKKDTLPNNVNGYLFTMANNALYHFTKMKKKEREIISRLEETKLRNILKDNLVEKDFSSVDKVEEMYQALDKGFQKMGERCKKLLKMNLIEEQTIRKIAPLMNFPTENAATQKKSSCLKKLRKLVYFEIHHLETK